MTDREILKEILRLLQARFPKDVPEQKMSMKDAGKKHHVRIGINGKLSKRIEKMAKYNFTRSPIVARRLVYEGLKLNGDNPISLDIDKLLQTTHERQEARYEYLVVLVPTDIYNEITRLAIDAGGTRSAVCEYLINLVINNQQKDKHE